MAITQTHNSIIGSGQTVAVTFSEINTLANAAPEGVVTLTVSGARVGMIPVVRWRAALDTGVVEKQGPFVSAADTVKLYLYNELTTKITPTANTADVVLL